MLKVGIFGDSYSDPIRHGHDNFRELDELGWPNLLKRKYEIGLHAIAGSSVFYSYQEFLKYHEKYDKIVFGVTDPIRWIKGYTLRDYRPVDKQMHFSNYGTVENWLQTNPVEDIEERAILEALKSYYLYLVDDPYCHSMAHLMLNHMKQLRPDIILIPIAQNLLKLNAVGFAEYLDVFHDEMNIGRINYANFLKKYYEYRLICHMSAEMNEVVANDVAIAIESGIWNPPLPNRIKHQHTSDYYWDKISNLPR